MASSYTIIALLCNDILVESTIQYSTYIYNATGVMANWQTCFSFIFTVMLLPLQLTIILCFDTGIISYYINNQMKHTISYWFTCLEQVYWKSTILNVSYFILYGYITNINYGQGCYCPPPAHPLLSTGITTVYLLLLLLNTYKST